MKKLCMLLTILLALALPISLAEETASGIWQMTYYVDEFRMPTDEAYVRNAEPIEGIFSNSATTDSPAGLVILLDERGLCFMLYEYGSNLVKNSFSTDHGYNITLRDAAGNKTHLTGTMPAGSDRVVFYDRGADTIIDALSTSATVMFYIEEANNPTTNYLFTIEDTKGFADVVSTMTGGFNERDYQAAVALWDAGDYHAALEAFAKLGDYKDSAEWDGKYRAMMYAQGEVLLEAGDYADANDAFIEAGDYEDARSRVGEPYYVQAEALLEAGEYNAANQAFIHAGSYSDAAERVLEPFYAQGIALRASGDFDGAVEAFLCAGEYKDAAGQITETYYQKANTLSKSGNYTEAYSVYATLRGYKDVNEIILNDPGIFDAYIDSFDVGNTVCFGAYGEPIEWIVIDERGGDRMLMSKGLQYAPAFSNDTEISTTHDVSWSNSNLRKYLNTDFYDSHFSDEEKTQILETHLSNTDYVVYRNEIRLGAYRSESSIKEALTREATDDKVFILDADQCVELLSDETMKAGLDNWRLRSVLYIYNRANFIGTQYYRQGIDAYIPFGTGVNYSGEVMGVVNERLITSIYAKQTDFDLDDAIFVRPVIWIRVDPNYVESTPEPTATPTPKPTPTLKPTPSPTPKIVYPTLQIGSKGDDVVRLQQALIDGGYLSGRADGDFGKGTEAAVKAAQQAFGLEQTGAADDALQKKLYGE